MSKVVCPNCQNSISEDFGLINCSKCQTPLLIEIDGTVKAFGGTNTSQNETSQSGIKNSFSSIKISHESDHSSLQDLNEGQGIKEDINNSILDSFDLNDGDIQLNDEEWNSKVISSAPELFPELFDDQEEISGNQEFDVNQEVQNEKINVNETLEPIDNSQPIEESWPEESLIENVKPIEDLSDIASFGNSTENTDSGPLRINLFISGIDSPAIRNSIKEVIQDKKFAWDVEQVLKSIKGGKLKITNVSTLKAAILLERIKSLPVNVNWEQHSLNLDI